MVRTSGLLEVQSRSVVENNYDFSTQSCISQNTAGSSTKWMTSFHHKEEDIVEREGTGTCDHRVDNQLPLVLSTPFPSILSSTNGSVRFEVVEFSVDLHIPNT